MHDQLAHNYVGLLKTSAHVVFTFQTHVSHIKAITLYHCNSSADCTKELLKPSKDVASLLDCSETKLEGFGLHFFVGDVISGVKKLWPKNNKIID